MKTFLYIVLLIILGGCNSIQPDTDPIHVEGCAVSIAIESPVSRSLSNNIAEAWEKKVNTAKIYIFAPSGKTIYSYTLTTADLNTINNSTSKIINFIIPGNLPSCDIYFVANTTPSASPLTTKASFLTSFEQDVSSYNSTFAKVTTSANRSNGFVMTASQDGVVLNASQTTSVSLSLKRIVAKIAMSFKFTTIIGLGAITMNNTVVTQSSPYSNLFPLANAKTGGTAVTFTQVPQITDTATIYRALFYVYENDQRPSNTNWINVNFSGSGMLLVISTPFAYNFKISGEMVSNAGTGKIVRNKMYLIKVNVTKLTTILGRGSPPFEVSIEESDW